MDANNNYNTDSDQLTTESPIKGAFSAKVSVQNFCLLIYRIFRMNYAHYSYPACPMTLNRASSTCSFIKWTVSDLFR